MWLARDTRAYAFRRGIEWSQIGCIVSPFAQKLTITLASFPSILIVGRAFDGESQHNPAACPRHSCPTFSPPHCSKTTNIPAMPAQDYVSITGPTWGRVSFIHLFLST